MLPKQIAGIPIPDSALAAEATELVRDTGVRPPVRPLPAGLPVRCPARPTSRAEVRPRAALHRGDLPRHGADREIPQPGRAFRGGRGQRGQAVPGAARRPRGGDRRRLGRHRVCTPRRASPSGRSPRSPWSPRASSWTSWAWATTTCRTTPASRSWRRSRGSISSGRSSRPSPTGSRTSRRPPSATSRPTCSTNCSRATSGRISAR